MKHQNTIQLLQAKPTNAITIVNLATLRNVEYNFTNAQLIAKYGSFEAMLETLGNSGIRSIRIQDGVTNGNRIRYTGEGYELDLIAPDTTAQPSLPTAGVQPNMSQHMLNAPHPGMGTGLNAVQFYNAMDYDRVAREKDRLQLENDQQKKEIERLKEEALKDKYSEAKATGNNEMLLGILGLAAPIVAGKFGVKNPVTAGAVAEMTGLAGAEISETKMQVFEIIKLLDDETVYTLGEIARNLNNEVFANEILELCSKHNIAQ